MRDKSPDAFKLICSDIAWDVTGFLIPYSGDGRWWMEEFHPLCVSGHCELRFEQATVLRKQTADPLWLTMDIQQDAV